MKITIRQADLKSDKALLIATLGRYLTPSSNEERFRWLYEQNPHGPARAWLALDSTSGATVGASAAFPRKIVVEEGETTAWVLGDFCIADEYRSLGPALQLQRATLAAVKGVAEAKCCYDFPSRQLTATYSRLGISPVGQMVRLARPLRLDRKLKELTKFGAIAKPLSWIANTVIRMTENHTNQLGMKFEIHSGKCGSEFTQLADSARSRAGVQLRRSAENLNWRYLQHPFVRYRILTARKAGDLRGYLVLSSGLEDAHISEWCAADDETTTALINESVRRLRKTGAITLSTWLLDKDPQSELLKQLRFWPRESSPVMVYWPESDSDSQRDWLLMHGDRDS